MKVEKNKQINKKIKNLESDKSSSKTINGTKIKSDNDQKYFTINNEMILKSVEDSIDGSSCVHGRGPACYVQPVKLNSKNLPHMDLNLGKDELLKVLRTMLLARISDEKHLTLVKQGKSFFHIGGSGHEATQVAIGLSLEKGKDWGWTYYRDNAFSYAMGMTSKDYFLLAAAKPDCPSTGGRQMPGHFGNPKLNLPTQSSPT